MSTRKQSKPLFQHLRISSTNDNTHPALSMTIQAQSPRTQQVTSPKAGDLPLSPKKEKKPKKEKLTRQEMEQKLAELKQELRERKAQNGTEIVALSPRNDKKPNKLTSLKSRQEMEQKLAELQQELDDRIAEKNAENIQLQSVTSPKAGDLPFSPKKQKNNSSWATMPTRNSSKSLSVANLMSTFSKKKLLNKARSNSVGLSIVNASEESKEEPMAVQSPKAGDLPIIPKKVKKAKKDTNVSQESKEEPTSEELQRKVTTHNDLIQHAQDLITAANQKIQTLTERCESHQTNNDNLGERIHILRTKSEKRDSQISKYKREIGSQQHTITKWKAKMTELTEEMTAIREKERLSEMERSNQLFSLSDNLYKVNGDSVSRLKFNKQSRKLVVFTEKINHLFYYDDSGLKLVFVRGISVSNSEIEAQIGGRPWFLVIGKKRSVLFVTDGIAQRDRWVQFINTSLLNRSNFSDEDEEISVATSVVSLDYDAESTPSLSPMPSFTNQGHTPAQTQTRGRSASHSLNQSHARSHKRNNSLSLTVKKPKRNNSLSLAKNVHTLMSTFSKKKLLNKPRSNSASLSGGPTYVSKSSMNLLSPSTDDPNAKVYVMVLYEIKPDKTDLFLQTMQHLVSESNKEKGCLHYNLHRDRNYKHKFVMMEAWETQKDLTHHLQKQDLKRYRDVISKGEVHMVRPDVFFCHSLM